MSDRYLGTVRAPEFPAGLDWLNVPGPLSLQALRGKVVIFDFWTFCCINCHHVLPQLRKLEERFPSELVVIGVHSPKFHAEAETHNLRAAIVRHDIRHPVVNDRGFLLFRAYAARAWPTIMVVNPDGKIVGGSAGEFDAEDLVPLIQGLIDGFDGMGRLNRQPLESLFEKLKLPERLLSFPGKLAVDPSGERLFIADTGHHRVLQFSLPEGRLKAVWGGLEPGWVDGTPIRSRFNSPQGLCVSGDSVFVADTENHAVREISLSGRSVRTIAGTGRQNRKLGAPGGSFPARNTDLSSPWAVTAQDDQVVVAMAGHHQLWQIRVRAGMMEPLAGDGHESLRDGPAAESRLAQPSGLCRDGSRIWFADSETSAVRSLEFRDPDPVVRTWVGQGLFEFGDEDGGRGMARLQHPLDVAAADGLVYIADSYNHKLKTLDPQSGRVRRFCGSGEPGFFDGPAAAACFWEPSGLAVWNDWLLIADTNNHVIRRVHRRTGDTGTLDLQE